MRERPLLASGGGSAGSNPAGGTPSTMRWPSAERDLGYATGRFALRLLRPSALHTVSCGTTCPCAGRRVVFASPWTRTFRCPRSVRRHPRAIPGTRRRSRPHLRMLERCHDDPHGAFLVVHQVEDPPAAGDFDLHWGSRRPPWSPVAKRPLRRVCRFAGVGGAGFVRIRSYAHRAGEGACLHSSLHPLAAWLFAKPRRRDGAPAVCDVASPHIRSRGITDRR